MSALGREVGLDEGAAVDDLADVLDDDGGIEWPDGRAATRADEHLDFALAYGVAPPPGRREVGDQFIDRIEDRKGERLELWTDQLLEDERWTGPAHGHGSGHALVEEMEPAPDGLGQAIKPVLGDLVDEGVVGVSARSLSFCGTKLQRESLAGELRIERELS